MGLWVPNGAGGWSFKCGNNVGVRPLGGTAITPGNNTFGTYTQLLTAAQVSQDLQRLEIGFYLGSGTGIRDILCTIGIDPAGGTNPANAIDLIPNLLASCASPVNGGNGIHYVFPLFVKSGVSLWCKSMVNNATVGTVTCTIRGFGQPRDPRAVRCGSFVESVGATPASSSGTAATAGTNSEGAWTQLGTTTKDTWWHQLGMGYAATSGNGGFYHGDLAVGDATNKDVLISDARFQTTTSRTVSLIPEVAERPIPGGSTMYGRLQCSIASADSGLSLISYHLGG